jgi:hypothetical protein
MIDLHPVASNLRNHIKMTTVGRFDALRGCVFVGSAGTAAITYLVMTNMFSPMKKHAEREMPAD